MRIGNNLKMEDTYIMLKQKSCWLPPSVAIHIISIGLQVYNFKHSGTMTALSPAASTAQIALCLKAA